MAGYAMLPSVRVRRANPVRLRSQNRSGIGAGLVNACKRALEYRRAGIPTLGSVFVVVEMRIRAQNHTPCYESESGSILIPTARSARTPLTLIRFRESPLTTGSKGLQTSFGRV